MKQGGFLFKEIFFPLKKSLSFSMLHPSFLSFNYGKIRSE